MQNSKHFHGIMQTVVKKPPLQVARSCFVTVHMEAHWKSNVNGFYNDKKKRLCCFIY